MNNKNCLADCYNYAGARADANHFEEELDRYKKVKDTWQRLYNDAEEELTQMENKVAELNKILFSCDPTPWQEEASNRLKSCREALLHQSNAKSKWRDRAEAMRKENDLMRELINEAMMNPMHPYSACQLQTALELKNYETL